jgi:hypothetical protein
MHTGVLKLVHKHNDLPRVLANHVGTYKTGTIQSIDTLGFTLFTGHEGP